MENYSPEFDEFDKFENLDTIKQKNEGFTTEKDLLETMSYELEGKKKIGSLIEEAFALDEEFSDIQETDYKKPKKTIYIAENSNRNKKQKIIKLNNNNQNNHNKADQYKYAA